MEIADLFVINKADLDGVRKLKTQLREFLHIVDSKSWKPPIVETISTENKGIDQLWEKCVAHKHFLYETDYGKQKRNEQLTFEVFELIREALWKEVHTFITQDETKRVALEHITDPYQLAREWLADWKKGRGEPES